MNERQNEILNWVQQCDLLLVEDMVERFGVSSQTIRKDINQLAERHLVRRQHGGIAPVSTAENLPFDNRQLLNSKAKMDIALAVVQIIPNGASVFLGIGTTVEYVAKALVHHKDLQVFTNNLTVAGILSQCQDIYVHMTAGRLRHRHKDLVGSDTLESIRRYYFDYGILGCGGLHTEQGILDFDPEEAAVSRVLVSQCRHPILVADQHKWGRKALAKVVPFSAIESFYTDQIDEQQTAKLADRDVAVFACTHSVVLVEVTR
ncbi:DeoR/GlpR transcriptional regulator [Maribrevibacterium harenarium]|uniref:DeoR/GlpR transcriptional regulator n=1 Tax=Maribrevibacterium harenarium TaxID=2589817 RepID=A0A501WFG7_9GAMM|nr:DeoR/GlpR transcriptional regulator [Maribrevibacterium harenarium]